MNTALQTARQQVCESGDGSALIALVPYAAYLGIQLQLSTIPEGSGSQDLQALFRLPFRPDLIGNPRLPALHGGVIAGFMENAALLHLLLLPIESQTAQRIPKSIDFSIDYLHSARAEDLYAQCTVERIGRRVAQVQIRCTQKLRGKDAESAAQQSRSIALARAHFQLSATE